MQFRTVPGEKAGPDALGILTPPGKRTVLILRPRALEWDLLATGPHEGPEPRFLEMGQEEAADKACALFDALQGFDGGWGGASVESWPGVPGYQVRIDFGAFTLVPCPRRPRQAYRPMVFDDYDEAFQALLRVTEALLPSGGVEKEVYFNARHFAR